MTPTPGLAVDRRQRPMPSGKPKWLGRRITSPMQALPELPNIGGQQSGTTARFGYLVPHPYILSPPVKVHLFDHNYDSRPLRSPSTSAALSHRGLAPFESRACTPKNGHPYEPMANGVREKLGPYYRKPVGSRSSLVGMEFPWRL